MTKNQSRLIQILVQLARVVMGATFLFSGFVKAVDPFGFTYKIEDYLVKLNVVALFPLALPAAVFMVVAEFLLGVLLLLGIYRRWTTRLIGVFMLFFMPLTLWIAIANPVQDCGCFGDFLIIGNWTTFYKNVVLSVCTIILIVWWQKITPLFSPKTAWMAAAFSAVFGILFALHNVYNLPVFDFRPYHIGSNIPEKMHVDPEKADVFENIFIYSKDGAEQEFTDENYPWNDSTWVFVDMKSRLVRAGEKPPIAEFTIELLHFGDSADDWTQEDITDAVLSSEGYTFLMVAYSLNSMSTRYINRFEAMADYAAQQNISFYCLTASSVEAIAEWQRTHPANFVFAHADERVLKTMVRSNPGLLLLQGGTVVNKWNGSHLPAAKRLNTAIADAPFAKIKDRQTNNAATLAVILLIFILPLGILKWIDSKKA